MKKGGCGQPAAPKSHKKFEQNPIKSPTTESVMSVDILVSPKKKGRKKAIYLAVFPFFHWNSGPKPNLKEPK